MVCRERRENEGRGWGAQGGCTELAKIFQSMKLQVARPIKNRP